MALIEQLGLTDDEWSNVSQSSRDKLIESYGKIVANRLLMVDGMLQDDHADASNRTKAVTNQLMGMDANSCEDAQGGLPEGEDVRVTILGDVQGDTALAAIQQISQAVPDTPPQPPPDGPGPPPNLPQKLGFPWLQAATAAGVMATGLGVGGVAYQLGRPQFVDIPPTTTTIDLEAYTELEASLGVNEGAVPVE